MSDSRIDWWPPIDGTSPSGTGDPGPGEPPPPSRRSRAREREQQARRRSQSRRNAVVAIVTAVVLLAGAGYVGVSLVRGHKAADGPSVEAVADYPGPGFPSATVVINAGDTGAAMANALVQAGVVATAKAFTDAFAANPDAAKIQPGTYSLLLQMKASDAVVALLTPANRVSLKLTIPEGWTVKQIEQKITEVTLIPAADLDAALADPASIGLPDQAGGNAEGWLYPSTYQIDPKATAADVLKQMTAQTVAVLQAKGVAQDQWKDVLTEASLIEREAGRPEDRTKMSRVIANRLDKGWPLEIDASVAYGLGISGTDLTTADTQNPDNPYNTYKHTGLPPTPIASPGEASIDAALHPEDGDWMFWCTVNPETKETKFAVTYEEHLQNVAELNAWIAQHSASAATTPSQ